MDSYYKFLPRDLNNIVLDYHLSVDYKALYQEVINELNHKICPWLGPNPLDQQHRISENKSNTQFWIDSRIKYKDTDIVGVFSFSGYKELYEYKPNKKQRTG